MTNPIIISIKSLKLTKIEKTNIHKYKPYGIILFSRNISNFTQIKNLIKSIKFISKKTLILIDQEGGIVNRFKKFSELNFLDNFEYYKIFLKYPSLGKQLVYLKSFITSYYLKLLGIDINTIPVLDLPNKNTIPMIKKRTFGPNINTNIILNEIMINISNRFGIIPVMKHIPGHGITNKDSHLAMPISKASKIELNKHMKLFKHFNYLPLAMTAHIKYINLDKNYIATFSPKIIKKIIRGNINFNGLIMSDDLIMKANTFDISESISLSNNSGIDILLDCSSDWKRYLKIIKNFNITSKFKNHKNFHLSIGNKPQFNLKSININHYHHLYNELIKFYGI
mgnify:CR=1 FL=1